MKTKEMSKIFNSVFLELNQELIQKKEPSGTTAVVTLIRNDRLYCANIGDSRTILCRGGKAIRLTCDHKPNLPEEKKRIESQGGYVSEEFRINNGLAISRAFGDYKFSKFLSCTPHFKSIKLSLDDQFIILACDGVWDVLTDQQVVDIALKCKDPYKAAKRIQNKAEISGSSDNISVIVINLQPLIHTKKRAKYWKEQSHLKSKKIYFQSKKRSLDRNNKKNISHDYYNNNNNNNCILSINHLNNIGALDTKKTKIGKNLEKLI